METHLSVWQLATTLLGGVATLAIFSFVIKENSFYRFFEHLFIGVAAGLGMVIGIKNFLWPTILVPMLGLDIVTYPDGTVSKVYDPRWLLYLAPMALGLLYYTIYSPRLSWLAKIVIGLSLGASAGLAFKGFFAEMIPQLVSSWKPLLVVTEAGIQWGESLSNSVFVVTLVSVMYYFFFSFRRESKVASSVATTGRWLMMVCFGAFFGSTVMARMALLVERLQFLLVEWSAAVISVWKV